MKAFFIHLLFLGSMLGLYCHAEPCASSMSINAKIPFSYIPSEDSDPNRKKAKEQYYEMKRKKAQERQKKRNKRRFLKSKNAANLLNSWEPYWISIKEIEEESGLFFQTNIGIGFLYFSDVTANIGGVPSNVFSESGSIPLQGRLRYNRTPLYEFLIGYQALYYLSGAISYQHQSSVTVFSKFINSQSAVGNGNATVSHAQGQFASNVSLDSFMLKAFVDFPYPMIWKLTAYTPYLGLGIGIGWQSWVDNEVNHSSIVNAPGFSSYMQNQFALRSKYSANFVWGAEAGFKVQNASPNNHFCLKMGCKYNQWGQVRSIGKIEDQGPIKQGIFQPFKIKTVYSFAPYLGFQWNIPNTSFASPSDIIGGQDPNTWIPYFTDADELQLPRAIFSQFTSGIGFLYFAGIKGNLTMNPPQFYNAFGQSFGKYALNYNRTPVVEYIFGLRLSPWFKVGFSKQFHSNIYIQSIARQNVNSRAKVYSQFQANLNLLSGGLKIYLEIPKPMIFKGMAYTLYMAACAGPSWQSWNRMGLTLNVEGDLPIAGQQKASSYLYPLRSKVIPNTFFMGDVGVKAKTARFDMNFYVVAGCKYNYWGSARNLGAVLQQYPSYRQGFFKPLSVKTLYSFVPYLGVQWDFGSAYNYTHKQPFKVDNRSVKTFIPFFAKVENVYKQNPFFTQVNTGVGFLYFERVRSNLGATPTNAGLDTGLYPFNDTPSYNRTPLFEFLVGRRIFDWLKVVLSYQTQGSVVISTPLIRPTVPPPANTNFSNNFAGFVANFRVDSVMAKFYFYSPYSIIWMSTLTSPYIAVGIGPSWQSWTRIEVQRPGVIDTTNVNIMRSQSLNQKISANFSWTIDVGLKSCIAYPQAKLSSTVGIKFNDWGQARMMGKLGSLAGANTGLFQPFRVRMVYSFAPYFGVQWNF